MRLQWRRWILWVLLIIFGIALVAALPEIGRAVQLILAAQAQWVVAAAVLLVTRYVVDAWLFQVAFALAGVESRLNELVPVVFASLVANLVGIVASGALLVDDAARRNQPPARATAGVLLVLLADYMAFVPFLIAALTYLAAHGVLQVYQIVGTAAFVLLSAALALPLLLGLAQADLLRRFLGRLRHATNRVARSLGRPEPLGADWVERNTAGFAAASTAAVASPRQSLYILGIAFAFHVAELLGVYALFGALSQPIIPLVPLTGYAIGLVFWIIGITPQGIGVVEGTMALTYISLGTPVAAAVAIGLLFRGLAFWLPLLIGLFYLPRVRSLRS